MSDLIKRIIGKFESLGYTDQASGITITLSQAKEIERRIEELEALLCDVYETTPSEESGVWREISVAGRLSTEEWFSCRDRLLDTKGGNRG